MMAVWETEEELGSVAAAASLPTPSDTPYRTPSRNSRRSRRSVTPPAISSSPPPPPPGLRSERTTKRASRDVMMDESISILDPRRFTPTLHANLVSEILALRRDQEDKLKIIESLEESLHMSREEQEALQTNLTNTTKESRSLKRQLTLLEGGTSSALGELARERDEAVETLSETKKRLETSQKKAKTQEEDSQRVHDLWAKEKDDWEEERRKYERKLHVADSRLKSVLDEVAAFQATQADGAQDGAQTGAESEEEDAGREDDVGSVRTMSMTNSVRFSTVLAAGLGKLNGHSLADELNFDDDSDSQTDLDGRQSVMSGRHNRNFSRDSMLSRTHARNVSIDSQIRPGSVRRRTLYMNPGVLDRLQGGISEDDESEAIPVAKVDYTDSAVQYSPPPSPKLVPSQPSTPEPALRTEKTMEVESPSPQRGENEIEANQRRKRVTLTRPIAIEPPTVTKVMVSAASQTIDEPISPPRIPIMPTIVQPPASVEEQPSPIETNSIATQTDDAPVEEPAPKTPPKSPSPLLIPSISIIPPTSHPPSPREHRLPQYSKDFGCQVSIIVPSSGERATISTQTDEIRIDTRLDKLPPHLHPSAISSRPVSPNPTISTIDEDSNHFTPVPGHLPPRNPRRLTAKRSLTDLNSSPPTSPISQITDTAETHDAYPGNNDDGPLSDEKAPVRRPHRISSLFAGFEPETSEEGEGFAEEDGSDNEFQTALSAPNPKDGAKKRSTIQSSPEQVRMVKNPASIAKQIGGPEVYSSFSLVEGKVSGSTRAADRSMATSSKSPANVMRKSAMIQSGIASHQTRSPSPLFENHDPPFPIPTRASSRRPAASSSAPSDTQRSPTRGSRDSWHRRNSRGSVYRSNSIRKVRSAAALPPRVRHQRRSSRSPPPLSPSEEAPDSPSLPPLPNNQITTPRGRDHRYRGHRSQPSTNTAYTDNTNQGSVGSSQQASGVVDAIAQTMVGEWMFKYVRRRKSFGVAEGHADENSGDRHKRWVWLAPYERAILWSSKQPQSGSALMGKSGRKLTIQSVLDVKDDNGPPKGAGQIFNRSILILTPQRALKFTATTAERHYLWLTALSFLAHSQQAVPEIMPVAAQALPVPSPGLAPAPKSASATITEFGDSSRYKPLKRGGIRDSIRLTKGKNAAHNSHHFGGGHGGHGQGHGGGGGGGGVGILMEEEAVDADQLDDALAGFKPQNFPPPAPLHYSDVSRDSAEPPGIPRFHDRNGGGVHERANQVVLHGRKRSNTGGHVPPPLSFRGFSSPPTGPSINSSSSYHAPTNSTAGNSVGTAGSSDIYSYVGGGHGGGGVGGPTASTASAAGWGPVGSSIAGSMRTSEASAPSSSRPNTNTNGGNGNGNFFEAIGTVRMEAFISPLTFPRFDDHPDEADEWRHRARRRSKEMRRTRSRSRRRDSYASRVTRATAITTTTTSNTADYASTYGGGGGGRSSRAGTTATGEEDFFRDREDPFKGF